MTTTHADRLAAAQAANPDFAAMTAAQRVAAAYAERMVDAPHDDLLDALVRAERSNSYGSHDEQIAILRAEILARMAHGFPEAEILPNPAKPGVTHTMRRNQRAV